MPNPIVYAVPFFLVLLLLELLFGWVRRQQTFSLSDTLSSLSLGLSGQVMNVFVKAINIGVYVLAYQYLSLFELSAQHWWVWVIGLVGYDFCYYWTHRMGHETNLMWASHVVHHSSEEYNYATALRQSSTGFLTTWLFFWPLAVIGVPPTVFVISGAVSLAYQFWIHTRHIGSLGWFDRWFASPSNHRVHHGQNAYCVDRNYGAILMLWDHLFKTFAAERPGNQEPIIYGIHGQLNSCDPLKANLHKYADLLADFRLATTWKERLQLLVSPPGWRPAAAHALDPKPAHDLSRFRLYRPTLNRATAVYCLAQVMLLFVLGLLFIGFAFELPLLWRVLGAAWLLVSLWVLGRSLENHPGQRRAQWVWLSSLPVPMALGHFALGLPLDQLLMITGITAALLALLLMRSGRPTVALGV